MLIYVINNQATVIGEVKKSMSEILQQRPSHFVNWQVQQKISDKNASWVMVYLGKCTREHFSLVVR